MRSTSQRLRSHLRQYNKMYYPLYQSRHQVEMILGIEVGLWSALSLAVGRVRLSNYSQVEKRTILPHIKGSNGLQTFIVAILLISLCQIVFRISAKPPDFPRPTIYLARNDPRICRCSSYVGIQSSPLSPRNPRASPTEEGSQRNQQRTTSGSYVLSRPP